MTLEHPHRIGLTLNGERVEAHVGAGETLLDVLRRAFHLYGARESCGQGLCGTCTVICDGAAISSCLMLARLVDGADVETVEGLGTPGDLSVVQEAFVREAGLQCGFCTPGMVVAATELLRENPSPSEEEIREHLAGNICRCGAYPEIIRAVQAAAGEELPAGPATPDRA